MTAFLTLAQLHEQAPGAWEVLSGPDGAAPRWTGPLWSTWRTDFVFVFGAVDSQTASPCYWGVMMTPKHADPEYPNDPQHAVIASASELCFRFDVPSVAAHVAGWCARALGEESRVDWSVRTVAGEWCLQSFPGRREYNWRADGTPYGDALPTLPGPPRSPEEFLRGLLEALAPRIASLGDNQ